MLEILLEKTSLRPRAQDIWSFFSICPPYPFEEKEASRFFVRIMANTELNFLEKKQVLATLFRFCKDWKFGFSYAENYLLELACYYFDRDGIYQQLTQIHHWQNNLYWMSKRVYANLPFHTGMERLFDVYANILMQHTQFPLSVCNLVTEYMVSNKRMTDILSDVLVEDFATRKNKIDLLSTFEVMGCFLQFLFSEQSQTYQQLTKWKSIAQSKLELTFKTIKEMCTEEKLFSQIKVIVDFFIHLLKQRADDRDLNPEQIQMVAQKLPLLFLDIEDLKQKHFTFEVNDNLSNLHVDPVEQKQKKQERRRPTRPKPIFGRFIAHESAAAGPNGSEIPGFSFGSESTSFFSQPSFASNNGFNFGAMPTEFSFGEAAAAGTKENNHSGPGPGPTG